MCRRGVEMCLLLGLVSGSAGCSHSQPPAPAAHHEAMPRVTLHPEGTTAIEVTIEVARTAGERERGLMYRERLEAGRGMLFLFEHPQPLTFWMRNTYIPLDMIFLGADRRVVGIVESAEPLTDDPRSVPGDSQYVLEVPGGWAASHRIAPGTRTDFVDVD